METRTSRYSLNFPAVPLPCSHIPVDSPPVFPSVRLNIDPLQPIEPSELPVLRLGSSQQYSLDVINIKLNLSTSSYSPQSVAVLTSPMPKRTSKTVTFALGCSLAMWSTMMQILRVITFCAIRNCEAEETEYTCRCGPPSGKSEALLFSLW